MHVQDHLLWFPQAQAGDLLVRRSRLPLHRSDIPRLAASSPQDHMQLHSLLAGPQPFCIECQRLHAAVCNLSATVQGLTLQ